MPTISGAGKQALDTLIENARQDPKTPPFFYGITSADGDIYTNAAGFKKVADRASGPVDADTVFWIASQTKLITHIAALQLVEKGLLSPSTPVSEYIPEFANLIVESDGGEHKKAKKVMIIEHLMHHTSGLCYPFNVLDGSKHPKPDEVVLPQPFRGPHTEDGAAGFLKYIKADLPGIPVKFEPGSDFAYGYSSDILGFVVEKLSGLSLEDYMQANILKPLDMRHTSFLQSPEIKEHLASITYRRKDSGLELWDHSISEADSEKGHAFYGGSTLLSSSRDYLTLLRHLLQLHSGKKPFAPAILSKESVLKLFTPSLEPAAQGSFQAFLGPALPAPGIQWSNGQAVITADWPGMRKAGSAFWSGYLNTAYFIDPTTGIAGVMHGQVVPTPDMGFMMIGAQLETMVYAGLEE
ncbi:beta-lactamase [Ephemerocybe angulata]|uniref:Beta-lactamase n=1 Tax=Ephemerocybe angulata TaxID=980116 RepID=A0A8H6HXB2_9AGAR|nr:beta-lactamase [Tulosesus angulatus]